MGMEQQNERSEYFEMEDVNFSDSELVSHVKEALRLVSSGASDCYNQLVGVLYNKELYAPDEVALIVTSLKAISGAACYIDMKLHESLLTAIFGMCMWNYGTDVMDALAELIICLAASNGKLVDSCLEMPVDNFTPPYSFLQVLNQPRGVAEKDQVLGRVHSVLKDIADLVPLAPSSLLSIIIHRMPDVFTKEAGGGGSTDRFGCWGRGKIQGPLDCCRYEDPTKGIFEMELEDEETLAAAQKEGLEFPGEFLTRKSFGGNVVADKLDCLMVFESLLRSFQITVLNAYKSKFAQFVMFYACSLDTESCGVRFAEFLADIFASSNFPLLTRMSAVAYLASYLARGRFLSTSFVTSMLQRSIDGPAAGVGNKFLLDYVHSSFYEPQVITLYRVFMKSAIGSGNNVSVACPLLSFNNATPGLSSTCTVDCLVTGEGQKFEVAEFSGLRSGACVTHGKSAREAMFRDVVAAQLTSKNGDVNPKAYRVFYAACQAVMHVLCFRMRLIIDIPHLKTQLSLLPFGKILKNSLDLLKVCLPSIVKEFVQQIKAANLLDELGIFVFNDMLESELSRVMWFVETSKEELLSRPAPQSVYLLPTLTTEAIGTYMTLVDWIYRFLSAFHSGRSILKSFLFVSLQLLLGTRRVWEKTGSGRPPPRPFSGVDGGVTMILLRAIAFHGATFLAAFTKEMCGSIHMVVQLAVSLWVSGIYIFIRPNFVYWPIVRTTYDGEEDDDNDGNNDSSAANAHAGESIDISIAESFEEHDYPDNFNDSLSKMSITPKDSFQWNFVAENMQVPARMPSRIRPSTSPASL
ncbi:hypothetical protein Ancab_024420 [Ancistrocladus abbreviatus]